MIVAVTNLALVTAFLAIGSLVPNRDLAAIFVRNTLEYTLPRVFSAYRAQFKEGPAIFGYVNLHSVRPGETFQLMLSTSRPDTILNGHVEVFRHGHNQGEDRDPVFRSEPLEVHHSESLGVVSVMGCNWKPSLSIEAGRDWRSGYYSLDFVENGSHRIPEVAYILVVNPKQDGEILVLLSTNTYQAYNQWGGFSLYSGPLGSRDQSTMVSFDRPTISHFHEWEAYYVDWLESQGFRVDYISNFDLFEEPSWADTYPLLIVLGQNEYWSKEEYDRVEARIFDRGKNTLFLGSTISYWQMRYADLNQPPEGSYWGRQLVSHRYRHDPLVDRTDTLTANQYRTNQFRAGRRRPESMLTGVMYESEFRDDLPWFQYFSKQRIPIKTWAFGSIRHGYFRVPYRPYFPGYRVVDDTLPFFEGTGFKKGDSIDGIVGYEWANREPKYSKGVDDWQAGVSLNRRIPPEAIRVVLSAEIESAWGDERTAEAVYFKSESGGCVFSAGTLRWGWALSKEGFVDERFRRLNLNLVQQFLNSESTVSQRSD